MNIVKIVKMLLKIFTKMMTLKFCHHFFPTLIILLLISLISFNFVLTEQIYHARIDEETPIGTLIVSLLPEGRTSPVGRFVILPSENGDEEFFAFWPVYSSNLTVSKRIDFEEFKNRQNWKTGIVTLQVRVGLLDGSLFGLVEIEIHDQNDNAPHFLRSQFDVNFREIADKAGSRRQIDAAFDADSPENGLLDPSSAYSIVSGNDKGLFRLAVDDEKLYIELLANELDREEAPVHRLQISARDRGSPALSGYAIVIVSVQDANDNAPKCVDQFINVTTTASKLSPPQGASAFPHHHHRSLPSFGAVQVSDADEGENGQIRRYSLTVLAGTMGPRWPVVTVDEKSGQLLMPQTGGLSCRDPCPQLPTSKFFCCFYQVSVFDNGDVPLSGSCRLTVVVEYANSYAPLISIRPAPGHVTLHRDSANISDGLLSLIVVTDADSSGPGGLVSADLVPDLPKKKSQHFQIVEKTARPGFAIYSLKLIHDFDWNSEEDLKSFNLSIRASDSAVPPRVSFSNVKISFEGEDDFSSLPSFFSNVQARSSGSIEPGSGRVGRFSPSIYHVSAPENLPIGTPICRPNFVALKPETVCLFRTIYPPAYLPWLRPFDVHQPSGYIITRQKLDREQFLPKSIVEFNLTTNCSSQILTAQIFVKILDENDNAPKFNASHFYVKITLKKGVETSSAYSFAITASDSDFGQNSTLNYWLTNISVPQNGGVSINAKTGLITFSGFSVSDRVTFDVCAKDTPGLTACVPVKVDFISSNSTSTGNFFLRFSQNVYAFSLPKFETGFVGCVKASASFGNFGGVTYKISTGSSNNGGGFFVHSRSGCIFLVNPDVSRRARQPGSPRLSLEIEASGASGSSKENRATSQVLIFQDEITPQLNVSIPLSALPENLQKFLPPNYVFSSLFKFVPAFVSRPGLTVNPHGQISGASLSDGVLASVIASNDTAFQKVIIQIIRHQGDDDQVARQIIIPDADIIRLNIDRSTPLFACLYRLPASSRCKLTTTPSAGSDDLISVNSDNNCLNLVKIWPLTSAGTGVNFTVRSDLICKLDAVKTRKYQVFSTFTESQHLINFINQKSLISINNNNISNFDNFRKISGGKMFEPFFQLPFPVLPVQGQSWAISSSGSFYLLPNRGGNKFPSISVADFWLGEPELGLISRPFGVILAKNNFERGKSKENSCIFRVQTGLAPGQSIGRLREHLLSTSTLTRNDRFQLLRNRGTGSRYVTLDWTAPFGDDLILVSLPVFGSNFTLSFRRISDHVVINCFLIFSPREENSQAGNSLLVFDAFLPPRSPVFDLNLLKFLSRENNKFEHQGETINSPRQALFVVRHEIDTISRSIRLSFINNSAALSSPIYFNFHHREKEGAASNNNVSIFAFPSNFSINLIASQQENEAASTLILPASGDRYQHQQEQQTSVKVIFRPSSSCSQPPSDFQLVVDEMRNLLLLNNEEIPHAVNMNSNSNNNNNNNINGGGITTACLLAVNDLETSSNGGGWRVVFRPAFLRRPSFGESVAFTLKMTFTQAGAMANQTAAMSTNLLLAGGRDGNHARMPLFKINNVTGEVVITGFAEKEVETFEVVATRLEDGMTSSLNCQAKFASFSPSTRSGVNGATAGGGGGSYYLPVYRFAIDEIKSDFLPLTINPRRQQSPASSTDTLEYRLISINPPRLEVTIDRKSGIISINFDQKLAIGGHDDTFQFTLVVDIAKRNRLSGEMIPVELEREITVIVRFMPLRQPMVRQIATTTTPSSNLLQFPRSRLFTVPASASIPYVLPVDFRFFSQLAEANPSFRSLLRSPDGCLRIDWANNRILLVKYFHNPPVTTCQLETDSDIFKLTFMKSDGWTSSERLFNASSIVRSEIVVSESLPPSTIIARIQPILQETTSVYLADVDPPGAIGRFYVTETGELLLHDKLDFDNGDKTFTIRIAAVQLDPIFAVEFVNLTLRVKDEDDLAPTCRLLRVFVHTPVPEKNRESSAEIVTGSYQFDQQGKRPRKNRLISLNELVKDEDTTPDQLAFRLVLEEDRKDDDNLMFSVDSNGDLFGIFSGNYRPAQWSYDLSFKVESPSGLFSICALTVIIDDIFDQSSITPCSNDDLFFRVTENTEPGTIIGKIGCGVPSLLKINPNNTASFPFKLLSNGNLVLVEKLDFERQAVYISEASLFDGPSLDLTVQVIDCNDQDPIVENRQFEFFVLENSPRGVRFGQIEAVDGDFAIASQLSFSLSAISPPTECFEIDQKAGYLFTTCEHLDRESVGETFFATIVIRDRDLETGECGFTSRSRVLNVRIFVEDVNDNPPKIVFPSKKSNEFYLVEDREPGFQIGWFRVSDPDRVGSEKIEVTLLEFNETFAIVDGDDNELRWLVLRKSVDFEANSIFVLPIKLRDEGGLVAMETIAVHVLDANEHDPHFSQKFYTFSANNFADGQQRPIGQIWANDGDGSASEKLEFSLEESEKSQFFVIDKWSGELFVNRKLGHVFDLVFDDSENQSINLTAKVFDRAGHFDTATLTVTQENALITPRNRLNFTAIHLKISETNITNNGRPSVIFNAFDYLPNNLGRNLQISLGDGFQNLDVFDGIFAVDPKSGDVTLERSIDFEAFKTTRRQNFVNFSLKISFTDDSGVHLPPFLDVKVAIFDVNDNYPVIYGSPRIQLTIIGDDTPVDTVIWTINATDLDSGENGRISYKFSPNSDQFFSEDFELDPQIGTLKILRNLDRNRRENYRLEILASDNGTPFSLTSTLTLDITVISGSQTGKLVGSGLEISSNTFEFYLPTNPPVDSIVGAVSAISGGEIGAISTPRFSLVDGDARLFSIGPASGIIRTRQMLFVFARKRFQFTVNVANSGRGGGSSATVVVTLNESVPADPGFIFDRPERVLEIRETSQLGTLVANMSQSLRSNSNNQESISYSIIGGNFDFSFNIDPKNGEIRVSRPLDYETVNVYHLLIKAEILKNGVGNAKTFATVDVIVTDEEDSNPAIIFPSENPTVLRLQKNALSTPGLELLTAGARDLSTRFAKLFNFLINNDNPELPLGIDKETGVVKLTGPFVEGDVKKSEFVFTIQAFVVGNGGNSAQKKSPPLEVRLVLLREEASQIRAISQLMNLHAPIFTRQHSGTVKSSAPTGFPVIKVTATDPDGDDSSLMFAVEDSVNAFPFSIENRTGVMFVSRKIDIEEGDIYVPVLVSDGRHRTRTNVHIEILPDSKTVEIDPGNWVEFDRDTYTIDVDDNWPSDRAFLRVFAISNSGSIAYSVPHPSVDHLILVNSSTGELALKANRRLPFGGGALSFKVRATCCQNNAFDDATIVVRLRRPLSERFRIRTSSPTAEIKVPENSTIGSILANFTIEPQQEMRFFIIASEPSSDFFEIKNSSLVLVKNLDFENPDLRKFSLKIGALTVSRDYASLPILHILTISVEDVNDCAPIFEIPIIHANLNRTTNSFVTRLVANDADISPQFKVVNYRLSTTSSGFNGVTIDPESGTFRLIVRNLIRSNIPSGGLLFEIVAFNPDMPSLSSVMTIFVSISSSQDGEKTGISSNFEAPWGDKSLLEITLPSDSLRSPLKLPFENQNQAHFSYFAFLNNETSSQSLFSIDHKNGNLLPKTDQLISIGGENFSDFQLVYLPFLRGTNNKPVIRPRPKMVKVRVRRDPERWPLAKCERDFYTANLSDLIWVYGSSNTFDVAEIKAIFPRRRFSVAFELVPENEFFSDFFQIDPKTGLIRAKISDGSQIPDRLNFTVIPRIVQMWTLPTLNCTVEISISRHAAVFREILLRLQRVVAFEELEILEAEVEQKFRETGFKLSFDCMAEQTSCRVTLIHVQTGISREISLSLLPNQQPKNYGKNINNKNRPFSVQKDACLPHIPRSPGLKFGDDGDGVKSNSPASFIDYRLDVETSGQNRPLEIALQFSLPSNDDVDHGVLEARFDGDEEVVLRVAASRRSITAKLLVPNRDDQVLAIALDSLFEKTSLHIVDLIVTLSDSFWSLELGNCRSDSLEDIGSIEQCWYWAPLHLPFKNATISRISRIIIGSSGAKQTTNKEHRRFVGCVERVLINGELDLFLLEAAAKSGQVTWSDECACKNRTPVRNDNKNQRRLNTNTKILSPHHEIAVNNDKKFQEKKSDFDETDWMPFALTSIFSALLLIGLLIGAFILRHRLVSSPHFMTMCLRHTKHGDDYRRRSTTPSSTTNSSGDFALHHHPSGGGASSSSTRLMTGSASTFAMTGMQVVIGSSNGVVVMSGPSPPNSCGDSGFIESGTNKNQAGNQATTAFVTSPSSNNLTPTDPESTSHSPSGGENENSQLTAPRSSSSQLQENRQQWALKRSTLGSRSASYQGGRKNRQKTRPPAMPSVSPPSIVRPSGYPYDGSPPVRASNSNQTQPWQSVVGSEWEYVPGEQASSKKKSQTSSRPPKNQKNLGQNNNEALYATAAITFNRAVSQRGKEKDGRQGGSAVAGGATVSKAMLNDRVRKAAPIQPEDQNLWQALLASNNEPKPILGQDNNSNTGGTGVVRPKTARSSSRRSSSRGNKQSAPPPQNSPLESHQPQNNSCSFGFSNAPGVYL